MPKKSSKHNGMVHPPQYITEVGKYLIHRASKLADAKRESLVAAAERAKLPFDDTTLGALTDMVIDFCNQQQHQEIGFLVNHAAQPWLNGLSADLKAV